MIRVIAYILFACVEIYTMDMLFKNMSKKKLTGIILPVFMLTAVTVNTVVSYFFAGTGVMLLGLGVITAFVFALVYSVKIHFAIISSVLFVMIQAGFETVITLLTSLFIGTGTINFLQNDYIFLGMGLICKFAAFMFIFFVSKKVGKVDLGISKGISALLMIQPIATVFVTLVMLKCNYGLESIPAVLFSAVAVLMIASNLVTLFLIYRQKDYIEAKERLSFANEQIINQLAHYEELYRYQNEIRAFRHDIKNKMLSVAGLIADGQIEKAAEAVKGEADFLDEANNSVINSGNPAIDAVLQSKLVTAEKKNIRLDFTVRLSEELYADVLELGVIIGNALDNAIEATEAIGKDRDKTIFVKILSMGGRIVISVENPVKAEVDTKHIGTVKADKLNHGYGLKSIKTIVQKYDGDVFVSCERNVFTTSINICNTFAH